MAESQSIEYKKSWRDEYLLIKGTQPLILVLARGMKKRWPKEIKNAVEQERLLIVSPFDETLTHITQETANKRNEIMVDIADEVFLAYATKDGNLDELLKGIKDKKIKTFE
jgi:hypothetical protein